MKDVLCKACGFVANAVITCFVLLIVLAVVAVAGPQTCDVDPTKPLATCNGDYNGDGALDIKLDDSIVKKAEQKLGSGQCATLRVADFDIRYADNRVRT